ncbi:MAG TPA: peptidoglycan-binding protein [Candidatus Paceibacterota bacterium]|nr:peptidoglycan-binding protein [Candidatus Paceibacterota bacterium]
MSLVTPFSAYAYAFYRNLKVGDTGEDVRELQRTLNQLPGTRVAETGLGSRGQETSYFGEKTRSAVIRYQELYARDILSPLGLSAGTGFVGASTRSKLAAGVVSPNVGAGQPAAPAATPQIGAPSISSVLPTHGVAGTEVTLRGSGFAATGNTVLTPFGTIGNVLSLDGATIVLTVREPFPENIDFPDFLRKQWKSMQYGFVVENENGRSGQALFTLDLF